MRRQPRRAGVPTDVRVLAELDRSRVRRRAVLHPGRHRPPHPRRAGQGRALRSAPTSAGATNARNRKPHSPPAPRSAARITRSRLYDEALAQIPGDTTVTLRPSKSSEESVPPARLSGTVKLQESRSIVAHCKNFFRNRHIARLSNHLLNLIQINHIKPTLSPRFIRTKKGAGVIGCHHDQWAKFADQNDDPRPTYRRRRRHFDSPILGGILDTSINFANYRKARFNLQGQAVE